MTSCASSSSPSAAVPSVVSRDFRELWIAILRFIEQKIPRTQFITWFRDTMILGEEEGTLIVGLPLPMSLNWHLEHYRAITLQAAQANYSSIEQVVYKVDIGLKDNPARAIDLLRHFPEQKRRKISGRQEVRLAEGIVSKILNPRYTLENFVVGANSRLAYAASQAVAAQPGGRYNPLFVYGGVGLGKTHLLQATGNAILRQRPTATVVYTTTEDFTNQVVEAIQHQKMEAFRRRYRVVDALIIDDVQFLANKERTQEEFFHTFNALYEEQKQIIISADRPPQELQLEDRLTSRFARGMIADISVPDYETRLAILVEKTQEYELLIDRAVLEFMAQSVTQNVRELEGILMQAVAQYELEQRMPTMKSIADIMCKLRQDPHAREKQVGFEQPPRRSATLQDVLEAVSRYYSVSVQDMLGASRVREILLPRQIAMFLMKKYLRGTYVHIGELFGNRDHTTVMHAVEKIEGVMQGNSQLLREVRALEKELEFVS